jgi:cysteine-rich repeat protein
MKTRGRAVHRAANHAGRLALLIALAIAFSLRTAGAGVWTNLGTFSTDVVTTIAVDPSNPSVIYAGTSVNGVYKTVDGGVNWSNDTVGLTSSYMLSVVIDPMTPSTVYAGTFGGGVFKTIDSGLNWTPANTGLTDTTGIQLVIDPSTPSTLYVATFAGVFKSIDGAANWSPASTGLTSLTTLQALAIDPVTPSTLYVASYGDGVFKTIDGAATWAASNTGLPSLFAQDLAIDPMTPTTLFVGLATTPSVHKSVDGGATWADSSFGLTSVSFSLLVDPVVPGRVWAGMGSGLHRSNDGGAVFGPGATGFADPSNTVQALFATATGITYAGTSACCGHGPVYRYDASCGDGFVDAGEECDDADLDAGDGCNAACEIEACNVCVGNAPSVCTPDDDLTCDDGDPCTTPDECSAGACVSTPIACPACEACTAGSCVPTMRTACAQPIQPAKSRLIIKDQDTDARDLVVWKWTNGEEVQFEDLGDPTSTTDYTLCVFDGGGGIALRSVIPAAGTCSGAPCWKPLGTNGWGYTDSAGSAGGFIRLRVKAGDHGRAKAVVKGKGEPLETPNLSAMTLPVTVQLQGEEPAACVEATFSSTGVLQSDSSKFIGRSD